jgi:hypothetical protein
MQPEPHSLRLDHPRRNFSQRTIGIDDCGNLLTPAGNASPDSGDLPAIGVKSVVDRGFLIVLLVGIMRPTRVVSPTDISPTITSHFSAALLPAVPTKRRTFSMHC